jgi:hypothetical protein
MLKGLNHKLSGRPLPCESSLQQICGPSSLLQIDR